jgi:outer membrane protein W
MSTFASLLDRSRWTIVATIAALVLGLSLPALADGPKKILKFGNPVTAFSTQPANTLDSLQSQFVTHRADLEDAIRQSGWTGNSADLFQAVKDGKVKRVMVPVGEELQWMAFRKNKKPMVTPNVVWAGKAPFDAWQLEVVSNGTISDFLIPVVCLNLSFYKERPAPKPSCDLSASVGAAECDHLGQIAINGRSEGGELQIGDVHGGSLSSAGPGRWTFAPAAAGSYEFSASVTNEYGMSATCRSASVTVAAAVPCVECRLDATYDSDARAFNIDGAGSVGTLEITGVTGPLGAGDMSKLISSDGDRWTYSPKKRKPGTYTFAAQAEKGGNTKDCQASATIPEPDVAWIFRAVAARIDADDAARSSIFLADGSNQRDYFKAEPGYGVGASIERLFNPRVGLEVGVLIGQIDSSFLRDIDVDWASDDEKIGLQMLTVGPNFHLTPDSKADVYIGPFLGYVQLDDATYRVLGSSVRTSGEDDFTWGAQIGLDVPTASTWAFTAGIKYLDLSYDLSNGLDLNLDPLIFAAGVAYRF